MASQDSFVGEQGLFGLVVALPVGEAAIDIGVDGKLLVRPDL